MFETGRLAPGYDFFKCVVNIPEDVQRVGEPVEDGEQMSVMASGMKQIIKKQINPNINLFRCHG